MTTYLPLVGIMLLVVFPLLIPIAVTAVPFCSNRFGGIANWRKTKTLPVTVPVFGERRGVNREPPRAKGPQFSSFDPPRDVTAASNLECDCWLHGALNPTVSQYIPHSA